MEQSRQISARSAASSPHNFSGRIIKGYLCRASVVWVFYDDKNVLEH